MQKIPVHIISGFLGSGKTTAILRLLRSKPATESWAILINEFGKISIDGQTLQAKSSEGSLFEISGGCICCSAQAYFAENLEKILAQNRFSRILIEPSGLGGLDQIIPLVKGNVRLHLMPIVCIVDIAMTKLPRLKMLPLYQRQIEKADLVFFSKTELITETELKLLKDQFCLDFPAKNWVGQLVPEDLLYSQVLDQSSVSEAAAGSFYPVATLKKEKFREVCLTFPGSKKTDPDKLIELLGKEPSIVRAKGYIYTGNEWKLFNFTMTGISLDNCEQRVECELVVFIDQQEMADIPLLQRQIEALFY